MTASNSTLIILGDDGITYSVDGYVPDAVATLITWNPSGLASATSQAQLVIPVNGFIVDYSAVLAPTAVGFNIQLDSASIAGNTIRHANQLAALPNRAKLRIRVRKGQILTALQF